MNTLRAAVFWNQGNAYSFPSIYRHLDGARGFILRSHYHYTSTEIIINEIFVDVSW